MESPLGSQPSAAALKRLQEVLEGPREPTAPEPPGSSAVLLPLFDEAEGLSVLLTRRHDDLDRHPGEVSFPGGRLDPGDASPQAAALREAREEVGILEDRVTLLGHLVDYTTYYGRLVHAYVGFVSGVAPQVPASPQEVDRILVVPVAELLDGSRYESRILPGVGERRIHYWHVDGTTVWGITGEILARFLARGWGWTPPDEPRQVRDPSGFRPEAFQSRERFK